MTELLHMHDNYLKEFDAKVISVGEQYIVLDRTAFYPRGGGQACDRGIIQKGTESVNITKVLKEDGEVRHYFDGDVKFSNGDSVHGKIDWEYRYMLMKMHTLQHVFSRYMQNTYSAQTISSSVGVPKSHADFQPIEKFSDEEIASIESDVNEILSRKYDVEIRFMKRQEAIEFLKARKYQTQYLEMVPESVQEFRIVIIDDYDAASCAGTHVRNLGEIGKFKILKQKNMGAKKRRIYFTIS